MDHPVFSRFQRRAAQAGDDFHVNFMGARTKVGYDQEVRDWQLPAGLKALNHGFQSGASGINVADPTMPQVLSEDYYEWIDLLTAICEADDDFVMIDLGAGYGRWAVNGAVAVTKRLEARPLTAHFVAVEADQKRSVQIAENFAANGIDPSVFTLIRAAVSDKAGYSAMEVNAANFGTNPLAISDEVGGHLERAGIEYFAVKGTERPLQLLKTLTLAGVVQAAAERAPVIDLINMDIQGHELAAITSAIDVLNGCVKRMHIATHTHAIEDGLFDLLISQGWRVSRFYRALKENHAEFGRFVFGDGIISCQNSRLT
jgi:FkbM family methyltransferase